MDLEDFERDPALVNGGEWVTNIPNAANLRLRVRGLSSKYFQAIRTRKERGVPKKDRDAEGNPKPEVMLRIFGECLAEAALLEWDGLMRKVREVPVSDEHPDGWVREEIKYDPKLALLYMTDDRFTPFADAVTFACNVVDRGNKAAKDEAGGNSQRGSPMTSNGQDEPAN